MGSFKISAGKCIPAIQIIFYLLTINFSSIILFLKKLTFVYSILNFCIFFTRLNFYLRW